MMFLILSLWLAIHATVVANSCGVCLLLQSKQLRDIPTGAEIDSCRRRLFDFEEESVLKQLRLPFARRILSAAKDPKYAAKAPRRFHYGPDSLEHYHVC